MSRTARAVTDGALVAAAQIAAGELVAAAAPGTRSPLNGVGRVLIDAMPGVAVDVVVATAQSRDKPLLGASLAAGLAAGAITARRRLARPSWGAAGLAGVGLASGLASAAQRDSGAPAALAAGLASGCAGAVSHLLLARSDAPRARGTLGTAVIAAALAAHRLNRAGGDAHEAQRAAVRFPAPVDRAGVEPTGAALPVEGITALYTDPADFYVTDVQFRAPRIDRRRWRLHVTGMVDRPLDLSFEDLLDFALVEFDATLVCVHNPVGGSRISSGRWLGVPVATLLDAAGVQPDAEQMVARAVDGFTAGVPVKHVRAQPTFVAVGYGGEPLRAVNGYPARLLSPGLWGADANTKWLTELELTSWGAVRDYWDRRGWPRTPSRVRPGSRIDVPRHREAVQAGPTTVAGVAWAPLSGVAAVEVALDNGPWREAELGAEVSPAMWRHWSIACELSAGDHSLAVRTIARDGAQHEHHEPPYPTGASGHHVIGVRAIPTEPSNWRRSAARLAAGRDDAATRTRLAAAGVRAWMERGYPPVPRFPAPPGD